MPSLEKYRIRNHLTFEQLGSLLGISRAAARNLTIGIRKPSVQLLRKMHEVTSIPVKKLLYECT